MYNPGRSFEAGISNFFGVVAVKANSTDDTMSFAPFTALNFTQGHSLVTP